MRLTGLGRSAVLVAGVIVAVACDIIAFDQKESETVNKTVAFPASGTLKLHNFSGDVKITATNGHDVVIKAVREADRDRLDHIKLNIETSGSTVTIEANKRDPDWAKSVTDNNVVHTTFDIQVPASAMLDVDVFSSDLTIAGVTGKQNLKTFSGSIAVTGAKAAVTAETFDGGVDIDAKAAGATPELTVNTFSGRIMAKLADSVKGAVSFSSFSGHFDSEIPLAVHSTGRNRNAKGKSIDSGAPSASGDSTLYFHTFSGNVKVAK
jgi:DUF4097 and DUF4098 domain-containing protein YvlB